MARAVARNLVVFLQRPGRQSQYSTFLDVRPARAPALRTIVDLISAQPSVKHSTSNLPARIGVSPRYLRRLFTAELGTTPAKYVERLLLDQATVLLETRHSVEQAARTVGFGSSETMRLTFVARLGVSPSQYRERFMTTARGNLRPTTR